MTFSNCEDSAPKGFKKTSTTSSVNEMETELYNY